MTSYTEKDIQILTDHEHIQKRTAMYLGNMKPTAYEIPMFLNNEYKQETVTFIPSVLKCVGEVLDNCIDEHVQNDNKNTTISIDAHPILGTYTISDNGRGVPIGKHESGKYTPEVVFGSLRSGRNFDNNKQSGVIGMNGIGSSAVCAVSTEFYVDVARDKKRYRQTFTNGASKISKPSITKTTSPKTGTTIRFQLDGNVFDDITLPDNLMENKAVEIALTNPGVTTIYNGKKYKYRKGFDDIVKKMSGDYHKFSTDNIDFYVIFDVHKGIDESIFSWVNSSLLFDGGLCNTQFLNAFFDATISHLQPQAKKAKSTVTKNDVKENLLVIGNLKLSDPEYDAQSKTRLTGPNIRRDLVKMLDTEWSSFARKHKDWCDTVLERAIIRHHNHANVNAVKDHKNSIKRKVAGLVDATSKNRFECQLLLTEGDSAAGMITDARNSKTTAALPLRGKVNNTYGMSIAQLLKLQKVADMITAVGLIPGRKPLRSELNYGKLVIATDADYDGADIFTLLINVLFQYWPALFDPNYEPFVHRLVAPNVCATKGKKRVHFTTLADFEKQKNKYKGWEIAYYKGLGSMVKKDWEMILSGASDTLIPIVDDGHIKETLHLLFGAPPEARRQWLQGEQT